MPRSSLLTAFRQHISGSLLIRLTRIHTKLDVVHRFIFAVSFVVLSGLADVVVGSSSANGGGAAGGLPIGWQSWRYPNPRSDPQDCGWTDVVEWAGDNIRNISWICDPDHILGYHEAYNLALDLERFQRESQCDCPGNCSHGGYRIAVALVGRLNTGGEFEPMKTKAKKFAQDVRVSWFTDNGCDDNVLILYSYYDDELYISLGEMAETVISDIELVRLNTIGDRALLGRVPTTPPPPQDGALQSTNASTIVPTTTEYGRRRTTTSGGLEVLVLEVRVAIMNGPSVSSRLVYAAVIPVLLVLIIFTMCLLANWCCRPLYGGYHQASQKSTNEKKQEKGEERAEGEGKEA